MAQMMNIDPRHGQRIIRDIIEVLNRASTIEEWVSICEQVKIIFAGHTVIDNPYPAWWYEVVPLIAKERFPLFKSE